ncbi:MAG: CpaD family pilus assembly lipoprotein [Pseudomonadota bacterium]
MMTPHKIFKLGFLVALAGATAGCVSQKRDSFTVGSVPEDYRTNHPIVLTEGEKTFDVPVSASSHTLTEPVKSNIRGFAHNFKLSASSIMYVLLPANSVNAGAAASTRSHVLAALEAGGVSRHKILVQNYDASNHGPTAPIRLAYKQITAATEECGRWPDDLTATADNKNFHNFGCASQSNLASMIENPADLMAPRAETPIDASRRGTVYQDYIGGGQ